MQYLLTEDEYNELENAARIVASEKDKIIMDLCIQVCNLKPVEDWRMNLTNGKPTPWGCIETAEDEWYCDNCPVEAICPHQNKHYSQ